MTNSLAIFRKAAQMLVEANTIQKAKELKDLALTAADWAKRKGMDEEAIQHCRNYALEAERKIGVMLIETDRAKGGQPYQSTGNIVLPVEPTLSELGLSKRESSEAQMLASIPDEVFNEVLKGSKSRADIKREVKRQEIIAHLEDIKVKEAKAIEGVYDVIVIDPPWPMEKIERDVRPNQSKFDYPTMSEGELFEIELPCADNCHVWLWTTQKFLPLGIELIESWGLNYVCTFVWHIRTSMAVAFRMYVLVGRVFQSFNYR